MRPRIIPLGILGCLSATGCSTTESHIVGYRDCHWPAESFVKDREAVRGPLSAQADQGMLTTETLYTVHFKTEYTERDEKTLALKTRPIPLATAELLPMGTIRLDQILREAQGSVVVRLQTAGDVQRGPGKSYAEMGKERLALDQKRADAVREYVSAVRPDVSVQVELVNVPTPSGSGKEATVGLRKLRQAPIGTLSRDAVLGSEIGASASLFGLSGGATGGGASAGATSDASAVSPPTTNDGGATGGAGGAP